MRFDPVGPDIPPELLEAQERGDVVFICGAGVSRTVDLPSFWGLTTNIYAALQETWHGHPAEAAGMDGTPPALDRALFALQTRLGGSQPRQAAQARRQIVDAVQAELAAPARRRLPNHYNLLRLSRDAEMRPRLVTTNFDLLFERAWRRERGGRIASHAGADMPGPGSGDFEGVLHLHGRIADPSLGLPRSDLVLNSAEFGEAYLRSGWASRYIYDLARAATLVVVGYGADDPPVRYLLEVLSADRSRFRDLGTIYAFAPQGGDHGAQEDVEARWTVQGVRPLLYAPGPDDDHGRLYRTLEEWASYADDPSRWRAEHAAALMADAPETLSADDWEQLAWSLGRGDGWRILRDSNPAPGWLGALRARSLLQAGAASPAQWISRRLEDRAMLDQVLEDSALDADSAEDIAYALNDAVVPEPIERAWRLLLGRRSVRRRRWDDGWHGLMQRLGRGDTGLEIRRRFASVLAPLPTVRRPFRMPDEPEVAPPEGEALRFRDLVDVGFRSSSRANAAALVAAWPAAQDEPLLRSLLRAFLDALEEAADLGFASQDFDRSSFQVKSISPHAQDSLRGGFYSLVRVIADVMERLAPASPAAVRQVATELAASPHALARRVHLHALGFPDPFSAEEAAQALLTLPDGEFWLSDMRREKMRLLVLRWAAFSPQARADLEARLAAGPPQALFDADPELAEQVAGIRERETFLLLGRLQPVAPGLSDAANARLAAMRAANPAWEAVVGERADFSSWSETIVGEQGDPGLLADAPASELVATAMALAERDPFRQGEVWRKFTSADPARAFEGLAARAAQDDWPVMAWIPYFWALSDASDADLEARTVALLHDAPEAALTGFAHAAASWLQRRAGLQDVPRGQVLALWDRLAASVAADPKEDAIDTRDPVFEVLNRAPGHLAQVLASELAARQPAPGSGLPADLRPRFDALVAMDGAQGLIASTALASSLPYVHQTDPAWAEVALLPRLAVDHPWAPPLWTGLVRNRSLGSWQLLGRLKAAFLAAFGDMPRFHGAAEGLVGHLVALAIGRHHAPERPELPAYAEVKAALSAGGDEVRGKAAYNLYSRMREAQGEAAAAWRDDIGPVFRATWPMEPGLQTADTAFYLVEMALAAGDAFPELVEAVGPALSASPRAELAAIEYLEAEGQALLAQFPRAALALLDAVVDRAQPLRSLAVRLDALRDVDPAIAQDAAYQRLLGVARRAAS